MPTLVPRLRPRTNTDNKLYLVALHPATGATPVHGTEGPGMAGFVRLQQPGAALATSAVWLLRAVGKQALRDVAGAGRCLQLLGLRPARVALIRIVLP